MNRTVHPLRAVPNEPTVSDVAFAILADSAPKPATKLCDECNGTGRVNRAPEAPVGFRSHAQFVRCWPCRGTGRVTVQS